MATSETLVDAIALPPTRRRGVSLPSVMPSTLPFPEHDQQDDSNCLESQGCTAGLLALLFFFSTGSELTTVAATSQALVGCDKFLCHYTKRRQVTFLLLLFDSPFISVWRCFLLGPSVKDVYLKCMAEIFPVVNKTDLKTLDVEETPLLIDLDVVEVV